jgi:hypothetical protein
MELWDVGIQAKQLAFLGKQSLLRNNNNPDSCDNYDKINQHIIKVRDKIF